MHIMKSLTLTAALLVSGSYAVHAGTEFFWRSGPGVIVHPDARTDVPGNAGEGGSGENPGSDPDDEHELPQDITLGHNMPSEVHAGNEYTAQILVSGNDGRPLSYSAGPGTPVFVSIDAGGTIYIDPMESDEGVYSGITFLVSDGTTAFETEPFSLTVSVLTADAADVLPTAMYRDLGNSQTNYSQYIPAMYDGIATAPFTLNNGDDLIFEYASPVSVSALYLWTSPGGTLQYDAGNGNWADIGDNGGWDELSTFEPVVASRFRMNFSSGTTYVYELRIGGGDPGQAQ